MEDTGFTALINHLDPRYNIPSRKYFPTTLIPEMYNQAKEKVKKTISQQSNIALTTDIWSSRAHDSFISFTAYLITEQFERKECLLQASKFNERLTGENIGIMINNCLCQWDIHSKLWCVLRDGGSLVCIIPIYPTLDVLLTTYNW